MSEQWHQHLQNLTWWEQIDRFWNPNKYSCSGNFMSDATYHWLIGGVICLAVAATVLLLIGWRMKKASINNKRKT